MKQNFYWILVAGVFAIILGGCKNKSSQEKVFKGEWEYSTESSDEPGDSEVNYFTTLTCDLYEKIDFGDGYPRCYGLYQALNNVNQINLAIDSVLSISADNAEVLVSYLDHPEKPKIKMQLQYNSKDSTLVLNTLYSDRSTTKETLIKFDPNEEDRD